VPSIEKELLDLEVPDAADIACVLDRYQKEVGYLLPPFVMNMTVNYKYRAEIFPAREYSCLHL
jgi:hypothetical protein